MKNYGLISSIVLWALVAIAVIFTITVMTSGNTDTFVSYGLNLTWITFALVILSSIVGMIINPQTIKGTLIGLGAILLVFAVAYGMSDGSDYELYEVTEGTSRMVSMGLNAFFILGLLAVLSVIYSAVSSIFK